MYRSLLFISLLSFACFSLFAQDKGEDVAAYEYGGEEKVNKWRIGGGIGTPIVHGDIQPRMGYNANFTAYYELYNLFAIRGEVKGGIAQGLNSYMNSGIRKNEAWNGTNNDGANYLKSTNSTVVYNFRTTFVQLGVSAELKADKLAEDWLNLSPDRKWRVGITLGGGGLFYNTRVNATDDNGEKYNYMQMSDDEIVRRDEEKEDQLKSNLKKEMDNSYETPAPTKGALFEICDPLTEDKGSTVRNRCKVTLAPTISLGFSAEYQLSQKLSAGLRFQQNKTFDDYLDGHHFNDHYEKTYDDWISYSQLTVLYKLN